VWTYFLPRHEKARLLFYRVSRSTSEIFYFLFCIDYWDFLGSYDSGILFDRRISTNNGSLDLSNYIRCATHTRNTLFSDKFTHFWLAGRKVGLAAVPVISDVLLRDIPN